MNALLFAKKKKSYLSCINCTPEGLQEHLQCLAREPESFIVAGNHTKMQYYANELVS